MTLPAPHDLEVAAQRSTQDITVTELSQMLNMYEPTSLAKLARKGAEMHDASVKGLRVSPSTSPRGSLSGRRSSSHFRELPENVIVEDDNSDDDVEESKADAGAAAAGNGIKIIREDSGSTGEA